MLKKVLLAFSLALFIPIFAACTERETPTSPSVTYPPVAINPLSAHMSVGDTVTFTASGGSGNYRFGLYQENSSTSASLEYFEVTIPSRSEFKVKFIRNFPYQYVIVKVFSGGRVDKAYIYKKQ